MAEDVDFSDCFPKKKQSDETLLDPDLTVTMTADQRQQQQKEKSSAIRRAWATTVTCSTKAIENVDATIGGLSYLLFALGFAEYKADHFWDAALYIFVAGVLALVKHKLPDGDLTDWLRKPAPEKIVKAAAAAKKTLTGR